MTPNNSLQLTLDCSLRLATPSISHQSSAAELYCYPDASYGGPKVGLHLSRTVGRW